MIKYEWRTTLSPAESAELADLLGRAAEFDAEPEYNTIDFADVEAAMSQPDPPAHHLLIWMLARATAMDMPNEPEQIAGLLRLALDSEGAAEATIVIDPSLRSIGIVTLLAEQVGVEAALPGGWMGTGAHTVTAWARGNHPAAGRLSDRFLIPRAQRVWKLIRSATSEDGAAAAVLEPASDINDAASDECGFASALAGTEGVYALREAGRVMGVVGVDLGPFRSEEFGKCATVQRAIAAPEADVCTRRRLLEGAAAVACEAGLTGVMIYVDSDDAEMVNACRLAGFQHDRTDVRYALGGHW